MTYNKKYQQEYYAKNKKKRLAKIREWNKKNPEKRRKTSQKYYRKNKDKYLSYTRNWRKNNPEKTRQYDYNWRQKHPDRVRAHNLKSKYGLSLEQYQDLVKQQNNKCAICSKEFEQYGRKGPYIDHDHNTRKIRGVLCHFCNVYLAWYEKYKEMINTYLVGDKA